MAGLLGCWREAERAEDIAAALYRIRLEVDSLLLDDVEDVMAQVQFSSRLLRDLYDLSPIYKVRAHIIQEYLAVLLPCYKRTLQDIFHHLGDPALPFQQIWINLYNQLSIGDGVPLGDRFDIYNGFLIQLVLLLSRPSMHDATALEALRIRIVRFRLRRESSVPRAPRPPPAYLLVQPERPHWAEKVFDERHPATKLKNQRLSRCFGRPTPDHSLGIPAGSQVLFKLSFDRNLLSVSFCLLPTHGEVTRIICRWVDRDGVPAYSTHGVHELSVRRRGSSLQFFRPSIHTGQSKLWLAIFFKTWEKMVLFHDSFVALKARCTKTLSCNLTDFVLGGEKRVFQERIVDDGFDHVLTLYKDKVSNGLRLVATVREGELRRTPVWTAFISDICISPKWLHRHSRHRIWLRDIQPYVFCDQYRERNQRRSRGEFELCFELDDSADRFMSIFIPNGGLG